MQNEGYSIEAQKELLKKFCEIKQFGSFSYYVDGGFSGSNTHRPMLQKLIEDCRRKTVDVVIVYKLDRLSRSQKNTLYLIEEVFIPNGVDFISISENFDTASPFGKAMIGILSVFAQLERETIKERTRMGMKERVKKGYWPGGGKVPYGYDYELSKGMLVPNERAHQVRLMYDMYLNGFSCERIAIKTGLKYDKSVSQILKSKINCGMLEYKGSVYEGKHEPIVSREIYESVINLMNSRRRNNIRCGANLLTGILYCGKCGAKMRYQKWGKAGHKICCYSQQSSQEYMIKDPFCNNFKYEAAQIENKVTKELFKLSLNPDLIESEKHTQNVNTLALTERQLSETNRKIKNLINFLAEGIAQDDIRQQLEKLEKQKKSLEDNMCLQKASKNKTADFKKRITGLSSVWDDLSFEQKRAIIITLIDKIVLSENNIDVYYTFE